MRDRPGYLPIHENLRHHVSARPDKLAVVQPNRTLTYAQLYESACRIAHGLKQQKIGQGDHVGIYLFSCTRACPVRSLLAIWPCPVQIGQARCCAL